MDNDELLTTTRAVRRRLDLDRPVDREPGAIPGPWLAARSLLRLTSCRCSGASGRGPAVRLAAHSSAAVYPVISLLSEQKGVKDLGGTMRLGSYLCSIAPGTLAHRSYGKILVRERHRHRYEFNNQYKKEFESEGLIFSGTLDQGSLCEIAEVIGHPWMLGVQFHPEFQSKPTNRIRCLLHSSEQR